MKSSIFPNLYLNPLILFLMISSGPFGQLLESIGIFRYPASKRVWPGSSHLEVDIYKLDFAR